MIKAFVAYDGSKIFTALHLMTDWSFWCRMTQTYPELEIREKEIHELDYRPERLIMCLMSLKQVEDAWEFCAAGSDKGSLEIKLIWIFLWRREWGRGWVKEERPGGNKVYRVFV